MGYFSNRIPEDNDRSMPSAYTQLQWRLDDLYERLDELEKAGAPRCNDTILPRDLLRYADPSYFITIAEVHSAIELAEADLRLYDDEVSEETPQSHLDGQMFLWLPDGTNIPDPLLAA